MQKNHGIALVEVLITTVITAIGSLAIILLLSHSNNSSLLSKEYHEALSIAKSKIEHLSNNLTLAQYQSVVSGQQLGIHRVQNDYDLFWHITEIKETLIKKIDISVQWKTQKIKSESISISTIIHWNDPLKSASISSYGVVGGFTYLSPNSQAQLGDKKEIQLAPDVDTQELPFTLKKYRNQQGKLLILNADNQLLLTLSGATGKNPQKKDYVTIEGHVYYQGNISKELNVLASQGGYCLFPLEPKKLISSSWEYAKYYCIVANNWHGKIAISAKSGMDLSHSLFCPQQVREYLSYTLINKTQLYQQGIHDNFSEQDFIVNNTPLASQQNCPSQINLVTTQLKEHSITATIQAKYHTYIGAENVYNISGNIIFPIDQTNTIANKDENINLELSLKNQKYDCRVLNKIEQENVAYRCVIELLEPVEKYWSGELLGVVSINSKTENLCHFKQSFETQDPSAILDLDLSLLCPEAH